MPDSQVTLVQFLRDAKRATYAAQDPASAAATPLLPGTKQLEFGPRNGYFYRDVYAGSTTFSGIEMVYLGGQAVWSMAYFGGMIPSDADRVVATYRFLRAALREVPSDLPVRGPAFFSDETFVYRCQAEGELGRFHGTESVEIGGEVVYQLHFSGGMLS